MIRAEIPGADRILLLGPVRGLTGDARHAVEEVAAFDPAVVGLGTSREELGGLVDYFVLSDSEPLVPLTGTEASEVRGLVRFGEVRVPNPAFIELARWGRAQAVPVEPLDPDDERSASLFTEHIGYVELVRRTVRERRVSRSPPASSTADAFALDWDREVASGRGSQQFARARDRHLARSVDRLRRAGERLAVVVDRERFETVRGLLTAGVPADLSEE